MRFSTLACFLLFNLAAFSQINDWQNSSTEIQLFQESENCSEGLYSARVVWTSQANQELMSNSIEVEPLSSFTFNADILDNCNAGRARLAVKFNDGSNNFSSKYTSDSEEWQALVHTGIVPEGITSLQLFIRFYDVKDNWETNECQAEILLDNISFTLEENPLNLAPNAGLETWATTELPTKEEFVFDYKINKERIQISSSKLISKITIFDINGHSIIDFPSHLSTLTIKDLSPGIYFLFISFTSGEAETVKFIKSH